jgi:hypothetical protein
MEGSPTKQLRVNWVILMSAKREDGGKYGKRDVPELPELSYRRHHRPTLLLANSPYLARTEGLGGRKKGMCEADLNHDGWGERPRESERGR